MHCLRYDVCAIDVLPFLDLLPPELIRKRFCALLPLLRLASADADTRVVHEQVNLLLFFRDLLNELGEGGFGGDVGGDGDDLALWVCEARAAVSFDGLVEDFFAASADVYDMNFINVVR